MLLSKPEDGSESRVVLAGFSLTAPSMSKFPELPQFALQKLKLEAIE